MVLHNFSACGVKLLGQMVRYCKKSSLKAYIVESNRLKNRVWRSTEPPPLPARVPVVEKSSHGQLMTMPAPTALLRRSDALAEDEAHNVPLPEDLDTDFVDASTPSPVANASHPISEPQPEETAMSIDLESRPHFPPAAPITTNTTAIKIQTRKIPIPTHRMSPLKTSWPRIYPPLVEHFKLQVRMNIKSRAVELRTSKYTTATDALQKGEDFLRAFSLGFDTDDAIALLRLDDLYIETFEIKDVKTLQGEHLGRAIGRIAGKDGKTKFAIENTSKTRVVLADSKIHILGGFSNIRIAREAVVSLILGAPPGKVYGNLRTVASRMKERY